MISFLYACFLVTLGIGLFVAGLLGVAYLTIYLTKGMK